MRVLVACEESQAVTKELRRLGHEAYSCDIIPCSGGHPEWHLQQDVTPLLKQEWDMIIGFPPCTFLSNAGARHLWKNNELNVERYKKGLEGKKFFMKLYNADCPRIAIENPTPSKIYDLPEPTQTIQPYEFGHPFTKRTHLWLKGLPPLNPTNIVDPERTWCPSGSYSGKHDEKHKGMFTTDRAKNRSKTFPGIAKAMAEQWGGKVINKKMNNKTNQFLYDYQYEAVKNMRNGCILNGGVGTGKSRTSLYYYFKEQGGYINPPEYTPMKKPRDLYIITTARKRDTLEWEGELVNFHMHPDPSLNQYDHKIVIDSWNNIKKYTDVHSAFFIFDEQRVVGSGTWVKSFLNIARKNHWVLLSATPGDTWSDYIPVFVANGFYKNKTEFNREHVIFSRFTKFPKIDRYVDTGRLIKYRNKILVDMDFRRLTVPHHEDVFCDYDAHAYKQISKERWNPYTDEPIVNAAELCYIWRRVVNSAESRQAALLELLEKHPKAIVFYNFDYELDILKSMYYGEGVEVAEWNGHKHQPVPDGKKWVYLVQYTAGCEGWNCIKTDTIIFYSQNYSYKVMAQASGRIDRLNTPFTDLYYYHFKSRAGIDLAISRALSEKKKFNESSFVKW